MLGGRTPRPTLWSSGLSTSSMARAPAWACSRSVGPPSSVSPPFPQLGSLLSMRPSPSFSLLPLQSLVMLPVRSRMSAMSAGVTAVVHSPRQAAAVPATSQPSLSQQLSLAPPNSRGTGARGLAVQGVRCPALEADVDAAPVQAVAGRPFAGDVLCQDHVVGELLGAGQGGGVGYVLDALTAVEEEAHVHHDGAKAEEQHEQHEGHGEHLAALPPSRSAGPAGQHPLPPPTSPSPP